MRDPSLTLNGRRQARAARAALMAQGVLGCAPLEADGEGSVSARAQLMVSSPLRRTLQTAEILCSGTLLPLVAHPDLQETSQVQSCYKHRYYRASQMSQGAGSCVFACVCSTLQTE